MKMLMSILFVMFLSLNVAFAADNDDKTKTATTEKAATEVVVETVEAETKEKANPEGLHCKKFEDGELVAECWICNCSKL